MDKLLKNKPLLLGLIAVALVIGVAGFIFVQNLNGSKNVQTPQESTEEKAIEMTAEDIGLTLTPNSTNTEVIMEISDVSKFDSFEYEMNYDAEVDGEMVPRGAIGSGEVEAGETSITREITIGTCSAGKCKYDKGVKQISFIIRLNLKDGQTGIVKSDLTLEEE